ncbi:N-acetylmuramoyl-L-alanine amidase [Parvularcula maris]|uniref:N-acetylmuramoyl-L-alanine amidase n=1 Tax=Parvularcula maris TaxID=2965077 RepID=A0A9X2RIG3_9PROT|nr:N-acetylmuramoyl-L-alanine amidase [Parvularcula maris]MCQ8184936.1 N-acetylmuramoyl-L-alanine amidase [Parvularcula maris]
MTEKKVWTSPNHGDRKGHDISMIVLHYTGMKTGDEALERLCDPESSVSAHYLIEEDGRTHRLVPEERRAWHAGVGSWGKSEDINSVSIGIELVNPGHEWGYKPFAEAQIDALVTLLDRLKQAYQVPRSRIVGHSDVAPDRKEDPGEKFPWAVLAAEGLALAPWSGVVPDNVPEAEEAEALLTKIGYGVEQFGVVPCITAFQRHFCPMALGRGLNLETRAAIAEVAGKLGSSVSR